MLDWFKDHAALVWWFAAASVVLFLGTIIAAPIILAMIPADYFAHEQRPRSRFAGRHPVMRAAVGIGKNVLGWVFVVVGLAMLVLPGQGLLTMLVGLFLVDMPGKYQIEKWLVSKRRIASVVNWLRLRRGRPPLVVRGVNPPGPVESK